MKKLFVGIAATVLAAAMCVSFAACGETGADKAKSVKGEEITAEQWDKAFDVFTKDDAKFTLETATKAVYTLTADATSIGGKKSEGSITSVNTGTSIVNGAKQSVKDEIEVTVSGDYKYDEIANKLPNSSGLEKEGKKTVEAYSEAAEGGDYTIYTKDDAGNWKTTKSSDHVAMETLYVCAPYGNFDNYKYDENLKGYVEKDYKEGETKSYQVYKFDKDGKLIAVYLYYEKAEGNDALKMTTISEMSVIVSYDAKDITLPTVA